MLILFLLIDIFHIFAMDLLIIFLIMMRFFKFFIKNDKSLLPKGAKHLLCLSNNRDLYYLDDTIFILKRDGSLEKKNISDFSHESIDIVRTKMLHPEYCLFCNE